MAAKYFKVRDLCWIGLPFGDPAINQQMNDMKKIVTGLAAITLLVITGIYIYNNMLRSKGAEEVFLTVNFELQSTKDTVVETASGIVFQIPEDAFADDQGNVVSDYVLEIQEAITPFDIISAGLTTMSDSNLLETAGMFKVSARANGEELKLRTGKEIMVEFPTDNYQADMMVFEGVETDNSINWVNPKKIEKDLITLPFKELNWYPPGYIDSLASWGYDVANKQFTDSLYYSFDCSNTQALKFQPVGPRDINSEQVIEGLEMGAVRLERDKQPVMYQMDSIDPTTEATRNSDKRICPASIRALQTSAFEQTFIATREFEERLEHIFLMCDEDILNIYISNLDKDLYVSDSLAATNLSGYDREVFEKFVRQRLGNTASSNPAFSQLRAYHQKKKEAYDLAARKTREAIDKKYRDEERQMTSREKQARNQRRIDEADNHSKELTTNLKEAFRQAGLSYPTPQQPKKNRYVFPITNTGWINLDRYVIQQTSQRESIKTTFNGFEISIEYKPLELTIVNVKDYDFVRCYLIPSGLNSFQRLKSEEDGCFAKLNELFRYELVCVGYKKGKWYLHHSEDVQSGVLDPINLEKRSYKNLNSSSNWRIEDDVKFHFDVQNYSRIVDKRNQDAELRMQIEEIIWPCNQDGELALSCRERVVKNGEALFKQKCAACHAINRRVTGPKLKGLVEKYDNDLDWLIRFTRNNIEMRKSGDARAIQVYDEYNGLAMNIFTLSDKEILSILSYAECSTSVQEDVELH